MAFWALNQAFRAALLSYLTPSRAWLLAIFVLSDKYAGPLGSAALDDALLAELRRGRELQDAAPSWGIGSQVLWSLRGAAERLERPVCQIVLLKLAPPGAAPGESTPVWLSPTLAAVSLAFVLARLRDRAAAKSE